MWYTAPMKLIRVIFIYTVLMCNSALADSAVALQALAWQKCPPKNPFIFNDKCNTQCCSGANWDLTCIGFVESAKFAATGIHDPQLLDGFPQASQKYGSAVRAFFAMKQAGRIFYDIDKMPMGAAVYFSIVGFEPGHIAIYSGKKDANGSPLIVTTGGPTWGSGIQIESLSEMSQRPYWKFLGWSAL